MARQKRAPTEPPRIRGETKTAVPKYGQKRGILEPQCYWNAKSSRLEDRKRPKTVPTVRVHPETPKNRAAPARTTEMWHETKPAVQQTGRKRKNLEPESAQTQKCSTRTPETPKIGALLLRPKNHPKSHATGRADRKPPKMWHETNRPHQKPAENRGRKSRP